MESCTQISECGSFVTVISKNILKVHKIEEPLDSGLATPNNYDLAKIFADHRRLRGWPLSKSNITVSNLQWELLEKSNLSTKFVLSACDDTLHLILIFILSEKQPIVIEADPLGVERLQWLPFYHTESSAYENCTILAAFTKFGLDLKIYSIINTQILFCVPKPLLNEVLVRPGTSGIWSVIVSSYFEKNTSRKTIKNNAAWPTLLHFHCTGTRCSLLASLKLDFTPSSEAHLSWSSLGTWLQIYDNFQSLTRHKQVVFNILGIHDKAVDDITCHNAQPTRKLDYDLDETRPHSHGLTSPPMWGIIDSIEYVVIATTTLNNTVRLRVSDISRARNTRLFDLHLATGSIWSYELKDRNAKYRRLSAMPIKSTSCWSKAFTLGSRHLISNDNCTVLFEPSFESPLSFKVLAVIITDSKLIDVKLLRNNLLIYTFSDHIALQTRNGMEIIACSRLHYTQVRSVDEDDNITISFVEKSQVGWVWGKKNYRIFSKNTKDILTSPAKALISKRPNDEETLHISTRKAILGAVEKVLGNRNALSDSSRMGEEITDTFHEQKKRRK